MARSEILRVVGEYDENIDVKATDETVEATDNIDKPAKTDIFIDKSVQDKTVETVFCQKISQSMFRNAGVPGQLSLQRS